MNKFFTTTGGYLKTGVEKTGGFIEGKISEGQPTHVSEATKSKWENVKQGTTNIFNVSTEYATKLLAPVVTKAKEYSNDVGNKINQSTNPAVKYAKCIFFFMKKSLLYRGKLWGQLLKDWPRGLSKFPRRSDIRARKLSTRNAGLRLFKLSLARRRKKLKNRKKKLKSKSRKSPKSPKLRKKRGKTLNPRTCIQR